MTWHITRSPDHNSYSRESGIAANSQTPPQRGFLQQAPPVHGEPENPSAGACNSRAACVACRGRKIPTRLEQPPRIRPAVAGASSLILSGEQSPRSAGSAGGTVCRSGLHHIVLPARRGGSARAEGSCRNTEHRRRNEEICGKEVAAYRGTNRVPQTLLHFKSLTLPREGETCEQEI